MKGEGILLAMQDLEVRFIKRVGGTAQSFFIQVHVRFAVSQNGFGYSIFIN